MLSQETVHRNGSMQRGKKVLNSHQIHNYSDILFIYVCLFVYLFILSRTCKYSKATNARQRLMISVYVITLCVM